MLLSLPVQISVSVTDVCLYFIILCYLLCVCKLYISCTEEGEVEGGEVHSYELEFDLKKYLQRYVDRHGNCFRKGSLCHLTMHPSLSSSNICPQGKVWI